MAASNSSVGIKAALLLTWLITLSGGVVLIGAVGALSSDAGSPFPADYKLAWTAISLEVASLLVALYALLVGPYSQWKSSVVSMLTMVTAILVPITNLVINNKLALPGANGSEARANTATAGLIIVMIGNLLITLLSSQHGNDAAPAAEHVSGKDMA
ncbi:hypothetical protein ABPG77_008684 [Micractinium sp. CCAP 211/92]